MGDFEMNPRSMNRRLTVLGHVLHRTESFPDVWVGTQKYKAFIFRKVHHNGVNCWEAKGGFKASPKSYFSTLRRAVEFHLGSVVG